MDLPQWDSVKKSVHVQETHWLSSKEKVAGVVVSKGGHANSVLGNERTHHNWNPWKRLLL